MIIASALVAAKFLWANLCLIIIGTFSMWLISYNYKRRRMVQLMAKIPGIPALPILGNSLEINVDHEEILQRIAAIGILWGKKYGFCKAWMLNKPYVFLNKASAVETVLSSPHHIEKSYDYSFLHPWLGTGLLTSGGHKWHSRRKILTPAFHFKILDDFIDIFNEQSWIMCDKIAQEVDQGPFNIFPYITLCTLDIICETAMGQKVNAQGQSDSDYVKAVYEIGSIVQNRQSILWLQPNWMFKKSKYFEKHENCIKILHGFSNRVIGERRKKLEDQKQNDLSFEDDLGVKKRKAFLDLILEASQNGAYLTNEDIREEVDTFMFEGHDTTSAAVCWLLFLLGSDEKIQDKVFDEINEIFGSSDRHATMTDLSNMKYLECCIKEALRLYPSVPVFGRQLHEDVKIGKYTVPKGATALIVAYQLHRDTEVFPNPEKFNPENFSKKAIQSRHPYAYIPFSAGPRNCIGQKFAILEIKTVVSTFLRKYRIKSIDRREDLTLLGELILRPKNGIRAEISPRIPGHSC